MAVRRAGKKRKKAGSQAGLQTGLLGGNTGEYAYSQNPEDALNITFGRTIPGYGSGDAEYEQWRREALTSRAQGRYGQALSVNKSLTYPEFLSQTYGTTMNGPGRVVGKKGSKRRLPGTQFAAGRLPQELGYQTDYETFQEQTDPNTALGAEVLNRTKAGNMSSGAASFLADQGSAVRAKYAAYKTQVPWQDWSDFLSGITTAKPAGYDYDATSYGYHANTGGGGGRGKKKRGGKR